MNKQGPIVIIDDDSEDHYLYQTALRELGFSNEVVCFSEGAPAIAYMKSASVYPFLVISDVNMPRLSGFALRELIQKDESLSHKCIPYLFFTTAPSQPAVIEAYRRCVQGFFVKPHSIAGLKATLEAVIRYWQLSYSPARMV
jgi:CheY-like chemotaxis protein